jgi:mevalonate pyrophosphate decarboxylase
MSRSGDSTTKKNHATGVLVAQGGCKSTKPTRRGKIIETRIAKAKKKKKKKNHLVEERRVNVAASSASSSAVALSLTLVMTLMIQPAPLMRISS